MNFPIDLQNRWHGKRFNSYNRVLKDTFAARVYKIGLRMDFTCPNRDGRVAVGGCAYCNNASHTPQDYRPRTSVTEQLRQGAAAIRRRHKAEQFIAYFQSYTNTYDSVSKLEKLYREALEFPEVVGLSIATRPDCVPDDVLDLIADITRTFGSNSDWNRSMNGRFDGSIAATVCRNSSTRLNAPNVATSAFVRTSYWVSPGKLATICCRLRRCSITLISMV